MSWLSKVLNPPKPPDPNATAAAQSKLNLQTAQQQYGLNATNQVTPYGSLTYSQNGTWSDGTPRFTATQSLSPEQQQLYDQYVGNQQKMGAAAGQQLDQLGGILGTPWNPNTDVATKLAGMQSQFLDPQWNTYEDQLRTRLTNQGIANGSDAWNTEMRNFGDSRSRAYDQMYLDAYKTALGQSQAERNQPFNELAALQSGSQIQNPNFVNTPQSQLSTPDLAGMTYQNYQIDSANRNAALGGIMGLGGAALGGWASKGFPMPKFA